MLNLTNNSFLTQCGQIQKVIGGRKVLETSHFKLVEYSEKEIHRRAFLENQQFAIFLDGQFYCEAINSFDAFENLHFLLKRLQSNDSLSKAFRSIMGGIYTIQVLDKERNKLTVIVDPLGCAPLYYKSTPTGLHLSNNQFCLAMDTPLLDTPVVEFLKYGYLPFSGSLYEGIYRLKPGERIECQIGANAVMELHFETPYAFIPPAERQRSLKQAAIDISTALDRYFNRLEDAHVAFGLSGGYDSRVIARMLRERDTTIINFGNPNSREVQFANEVAKIINHDMIYFEIRHDAIPRQAPRFPVHIRNLISMRHATAFELLDRIIASQADYYASGFIGDIVIGGGSYYKLGKNAFQILQTLADVNYYDKSPGNPKSYVDKLYNHHHAISDLDLGKLMSEDIQSEIRLQALRLAEVSLQRVHTHEDMLEVLKWEAHVRSLTTGSAVAFLSVKPCLFPYLDRDVFDTGMRTAKFLRAGDKLYNAFWRHRFPELAGVKKQNTYGSALDSVTAYRVKHLMSSVRRRFYERINLATGGHINFSERTFNTELSVKDTCTQKLFEQRWDNSLTLLPKRVVSVLDQTNREDLNASLQLRIYSLLEYLAYARDIQTGDVNSFHESRWEY